MNTVPCASERLSSSQGERFDAICDRFETDWKGGRQPRLRTFLKEATNEGNSEARVAVLRALIGIDIWYRWRQPACEVEGQTFVQGDTLPQRPLLEDYVRCFPELGPLKDQPDDLVAREFEARCRWGEPPPNAELVERFGRLPMLPAVFPVPAPTASNSDATALADIQLQAKPNVSHRASWARSTSPPSVSSQEAIALLSDRYELLREVGGGGMGIVYRARHRALDWEVAIKIMRRGQSLERFEREAKTLTRIRSPFVVAVHDFQILRDGTPILVMDWIDGGDLKQVLRTANAPLDEEKVLSWMKQTCEGMLASANEGIIHRDLKPANILIDRRGRAQVVDFGLARSLDELSLTGVVGTALYMSPEQVEDPAGIDTRSDIYSFGATFYHLLTGVPPFIGDNPISVLFKHKTEPLISPCSRNPTLSPRIGELIERCLAKSPADRFQSFAELGRQLDALATHSPWEWMPNEDLGDCERQYNERKTDYLVGDLAQPFHDVYEFPEGRSLHIVTGDITDQHADVIVNPISSLAFHSFSSKIPADPRSVLEAICRVGGARVAEELGRYSLARPGRTVVTSAGLLRARFVFHAVTLGYEPGALTVPSRDIISAIVADVFHQADTLYASTVAFPLLGTGAGNLSKEICLDTLFRALSRRLVHGLTTVSKATIVIYRPHDPGSLRIASASGMDRCDSTPAAPVAVTSMREACEENISVSAAGQSTVVIENGLLPPRPKTPGYHHFAWVGVANHMRGDYYDYVLLPDGRLAILVADIVGHGVSAALPAGKFSAAVRSVVAGEVDPRRAFQRLNSRLCSLNLDRFVTVVMAVLEPSTHLVQVVNAGHMAPLHRRADGSIGEPGQELAGLPMGIMEGLEYKSAELTLQPGESLSMFTDGLAEAVDASGRQFGLNALRDLIRRSSGAVEAMGTSIVNAVKHHVGDRPLCDDVTLVSFQRVR